MSRVFKSDLARIKISRVKDIARPLGGSRAPSRGPRAVFGQRTALAYCGA